VPLSRPAGKQRLVPRNHDLITSLKRMGISFGE
jgi:hypothetical protein